MKRLPTRSPRKGAPSHQESGYLVIMDSTHKMNKHSWKLYTVLVRNKFNSWLSGGHFFISGEEQEIVAAGLGVLKR